MANFPLPKGYQRLGKFPIDETEIFTSDASAIAYAVSPSAYPGQKISVVKDASNLVNVYTILPDGSLAAIGGSSVNTTASNGLTVVGNDIQLGGTLTKDTTISGDNGFELTVNGGSSGIYLNENSGDGIYLTASNGGYIDFTADSDIDFYITGGDFYAGVNDGDYIVNVQDGNFNTSVIGGNLVFNALNASSNIKFDAGGNINFTGNSYYKPSATGPVDTSNNITIQQGSLAVNQWCIGGKGVDINSIRDEVRLSVYDSSVKGVNLKRTVKMTYDNALTYDADYSSLYTPRSLVDKEYVDVTSKTYSELVALVDSSSLIVGKQYLLSDYQTKHVIPNSSPVEINTGAIEPLILTAVSTTEFHADVKSTVYPTDIIHYRFDDDSCEDGTRDITNKKWSGGTTRTGYISYRKSADNLLSTHYDWRNYKVRRWKIIVASWVSLTAYSANDVVSYSNNFYIAKAAVTSSTNPVTDHVNWCLWINPEIQNDGGFLSYTPAAASCKYGTNNTGNITINNTTPGTDYADYYTFCILTELTNSSGTVQTTTNSGIIGAGFYNISIDAFDYDFYDYEYAGGLESNVFFMLPDGDYEYYSRDTKLGSTCTNNTFIKRFSSNNIGDVVYNNLFNDYFTENIIGSKLIQNSFNKDCVRNTIGKSYYYNIMSTGFDNNNMGNANGSNILGKNFSNNTTLASFSINKINQQCSTNIFGNDCGSNIIGEYCNANKCSNFFQSNNILNRFQNNIISGKFQSCTVIAFFQKNHLLSDVVSTNFSTATLVYGNYNTNIFSRSDTTLQLSYITNANVVTYAAINA